jgi:hypothetical protein
MMKISEHYKTETIPFTEEKLIVPADKHPSKAMIVL